MNWSDTDIALAKNAMGHLFATDGIFADDWRQFCADGWPGLLLPQDAGGHEAGVPALLALLPAIACVPTRPPVAAAILSSHLLNECGSREARDLLEAVLAGEKVAGLAEAGSNVFRGEAEFLLYDADRIDVAIAGHQAGEFRLMAFPVGVEPGSLLGDTVDGGKVSAVDLSGGIELASGERAARIWRDHRLLRQLCTASELCALAREGLDRALAYLRDRIQFGVPIGSFQALQHRAASQHIHLMAASALLHEAAQAVGKSNEGYACPVAVLQAARSASQVIDETVQLHGAIGFTEEFGLGFLLKRIMSLIASVGGTENIHHSLMRWQ
jgi:alkylation response protein AidB-like acyl-CoA dehydrogenase